MCQPQPERTPMVMYEIPEPTTLPPTSRGYIYNANCCSHCQSGIDKSDKVCSRCGAPNEYYKEKQTADNEDQKIFSDAFVGYIQNSMDDEIGALEEIRLTKIQCGLDLRDINTKIEYANKLRTYG